MLCDIRIGEHDVCIDSSALDFNFTIETNGDFAIVLESFVRATRFVHILPGVINNS